MSHHEVLAALAKDKIKAYKIRNSAKEELTKQLGDLKEELSSLKLIFKKDKLYIATGEIAVMDGVIEAKVSNQKKKFSYS
ncbi:250_t:CDS:2 [Entrophospora sp. SA101]|nr:250_t:CDS:2 [Entrophospora sp. SA101]